MNCSSAPPFPVVDLESQAAAVARLLQGWTKEEILNWLAGQGQLTVADIQGWETFFFETGVGFKAAFFLNGDDFTLLGDHTTWKPKLNE